MKWNINIFAWMSKSFCINRKKRVDYFDKIMI